MKNRPFLILFIVLLSLSQLGMARNGQYDEEARQQEKALKEQRKKQKKLSDGPKNMIGGVKQATVGSAAGFIADAADETKSSPPLVGTLEGTRKGTEAILDNTVKGVSKVATLGYGEVENYEVVEPEDNSEDTTKITIKIPGT